MKIVVGLGNPGRKYEGTRHNAGYDVVDHLAARLGCGGAKSRFQADCREGRWGQETVLLVCPTTFMNLSGRSVGAAVGFYQVELSQVLVICDDINLPLGKLRFRSKGSAGGQKGLADIVRQLGTENVPRLRVGVGAPPEGWDAADWVLGRFRGEEQEAIDTAYRRAAEGVVDWVEQGLEACMTKYN